MSLEKGYSLNAPSPPSPMTSPPPPTHTPLKLSLSSPMYDHQNYHFTRLSARIHTCQTSLRTRGPVYTHTTKLRAALCGLGD